MPDQCPIKHIVGDVCARVCTCMETQKKGVLLKAVGIRGFIEEGSFEMGSEGILGM